MSRGSGAIKKSVNCIPVMLMVPTQTWFRHVMPLKHCSGTFILTAASHAMLMTPAELL